MASFCKSRNIASVHRLLCVVQSSFLYNYGFIPQPILQLVFIGFCMNECGERERYYNNQFVHESTVIDVHFDILNNRGKTSFLDEHTALAARTRNRYYQVYELAYS